MSHPKKFVFDISLPKAVTRIAAQTELAVLEVVATTPCNIESLPEPFIKRLKEFGAPRPIYDRFSHSLGQFVDWLVEMGRLARDGRGNLMLTHRGKVELEKLRREVQ